MTQNLKIDKDGQTIFSPKLKKSKLDQNSGNKTFRKLINRIFQLLPLNMSNFAILGGEKASQSLFEASKGSKKRLKRAQNVSKVKLGATKSSSRPRKVKKDNSINQSVDTFTGDSSTHSIYGRSKLKLKH